MLTICTSERPLAAASVIGGNTALRKIEGKYRVKLKSARYNEVSPYSLYGFGTKLQLKN